MSVSLNFCGAARTVTGSRYLLQTDRACVLVDAGMFQDREYLGFNWEDYCIEPENVDAVLMTHGHMDHCGWLPKLVKEGFSGPVYCTSATADLAPIIIRDIARIQEEDAKTKAKRHAKEKRNSPRPIVPLYDCEDAEKALALIRPVEGLGKIVEIAPGIRAFWGENGHILGASWVGLEVEDRHIVFSGDIGRWDRPILNDPAPPLKADYIVMESTYGDRVHIPANTEEQLREIVQDTANKHGNILIPSFSVERAQELLYALSSLGRKGQLPHQEVYLDSPMAARVTDLFRKHPEVCDEEMLALMQQDKSPFAFAQLKYIATAAESKQLNRIRSGAIIIAGNGMATGGRIKHHLAQHLDNPHSTILFAGFQAPGTLGRQLVDGAKEVRLFNKKMPVLATVCQLAGLSGHADRTELMRWSGLLDQAPSRCFITHGSEEASASLAAALREERGWAAEAPQIWETAQL